MNRKHKKILIGAMASVALFLLFLAEPLWRLEYQAQDLLYTRPGLIHPNIFVFGIDEETLIEFGPMQFWPRQLMADAINILNSEPGWEPAVIAVDILYSGYSNDAASDAALVQAAKDGGNVVFGSMHSLDHWGGIRTIERPFGSLAAVSAYGSLNSYIDRDGVVRRTALGGTFAEVIYEKYWGQPVYIPARLGNLLRISYAGEPGDFYGTMGLGLSFKEIFCPYFDPGFYADAIILIGAFAHGLMDAYFTPMSAIEQMHGVEIHANIVQMLLDGNFTGYAPAWVNWVIMLVSLALLTFIFMYFDLRLSFIALALFMVGYVFLNRWIFDLGWVTTLLYPLLSAGILYIFAVIYRQVTDKIQHITEMAHTHERHASEVKGLFESFVRVMTAAIDERTPYNATHTLKVAEYTQQFVTYLRSYYPKDSPYHISENNEEQLIMAAFLHDVGKITTPLHVMDKDSRLGSRLIPILQRMETKSQYDKAQLFSGAITRETYDQYTQRLQDTLAFVERVNYAGFLPDEDYAQAQSLNDLSYINQAGETKPVFDAKDIESLSIRRGTLTENERDAMQNHASVTERLLNKMEFTQQYEHVTAWAKSHHEFLDGSGYPNQLSGDQIPIEVRILTIMDIYDALTATDRPYKKATPHDAALKILNAMVQEGKLDGELVTRFAESNIKAA